MPKKPTNKKPQGQLEIRTIAMPADTNANGDIFGGWLVSQMDLAAGSAAKQYAQGRCATVAIDGMSFIQPVHIGDFVCCYSQILKIGNTSIQIKIEAWVIDPIDQHTYQVTEGIFVYVAIDENGRPRPIPIRHL